MSTTTPFQINDEPNGSREPSGSFGNSFLDHSIIHIKIRSPTFNLLILYITVQLRPILIFLTFS